MKCVLLVRITPGFRKKDYCMW